MCIPGPETVASSSSPELYRKSRDFRFHYSDPKDGAVGDGAAELRRARIYALNTYMQAIDERRWQEICAMKQQDGIPLPR